MTVSPKIGTLYKWSYPPAPLNENLEIEPIYSIQTYLRVRETASLPRTSRFNQYIHISAQNSISDRSKIPIGKSLSEWKSQDMQSNVTLTSSSNLKEDYQKENRSQYERGELAAREIHYSAIIPDVAFASFISRRNPQVFKEKAFDTSGLDKIFTAAWISESEVVIGTKCNRLVVINVDTGTQRIIPSDSSRSGNTILISSQYTNFVSSNAWR